MSTKAKTILAAVLVLVMCAFIFYMSAKPAVDSDEISLGVVGQIITFFVPGFGDMSAADQAATQSSLNHIVRKCAHFTEFAILGVLVFNLVIQAVRTRRKLDSRALSFRIAPLAASAWALATLYAATDEFHQIFVPGRAGMLTDICIDSSGVLVGILIATAILVLVKKRRATSSN